MLNLFQSNEMPELARIFCDRNRGRTDPFEPLTAIVQSFGIGQWLKFQLAEHQGISANVDCVLPATFLWRLYQSLIPETASLTESPFDRVRLVWRIMRLIEEHPALSGAILNYLSAGNNTDLRLYQLANEIALLYDEYLMYRPNWLLDWESGGAEQPGHAGWQADLWRMILTDVPDYRHLHRARLHEAAMQKLQTPEITLPWQRLSVFGLSTMPPLQLATFEALSARIEVDVYFQNPCQHYWGDVVSEKDKARRSIRSLLSDKPQLDDEDYLEVGNPLLSSLGKQGREFLELLLESPSIHSGEVFIPPDSSTRLGYLKNDILELTYGGAFGDEQPETQALDDHSIQVHCCHSRMREVEVLHDTILRSLSNNPDLKPSDIIVMVPDIADYAPFVESVFTGSLAYRISDRNNLDNSTLLTAVMWLLQLPQSRLTGPDVMDLLETPAAMNRFDLSFEDLETLAYWIKTAQIRWEYSGQRKSEHWGLPPEEQNTWQFGLRRLLLGFAMSTDQDIWRDNLPVEVSTSEAELLGTLCHILDLLDAYRSKIMTATTMAQWQTLIGELIDDFFLPTGDEVLDIGSLQQEFESLTSATEMAGYSGEISSQLVVHAIKKGLSDSSSAGFIAGGITFATLVPMRSIPFSMVCLLGINDGEYPRDIKPHSFDLIASSRALPGDRSKKVDDRYLFLEALLSAEDIFYTSFVGKGVRDNKDRPPSAVLGQLLSYLQGVFPAFEVTQHALQPFNAIYYQGDEQASFAQSWYRALARQTPAQRFTPGPLPHDAALDCTSLNQLKRFFRHPGKYFLNQRLNAYLDADEIDLQDVETFELNSLEKYQLAEDALQILVSGQSMGSFRKQQLASGRVLSGPQGRIQLEQELDRASNVYEILKPLLTSEPGRQTGEILVGNQVLHIDLGHVHENQLLRFRVGKLQSRHRLEFWIEHLAANMLSDIESTYVYRNDKNQGESLTLRPMGRDNANYILELLLNYYGQGVKSPLFLPPEASEVFVTNMSRQGDIEKALTRVKSNWQTDRPGSEGQDRHWQRMFSFPDAFDKTFTDNAAAIWSPILEHSDD